MILYSNSALLILLIDSSRVLAQIMSFEIMPKTVLGDWISRLQENYRVVGPTQKHGQFVFSEIQALEELHLDYPPTVLPPKKYIVPPRELLIEYRLDGSQIEAVLEPQPTVILGIHTCDLHAIKLLDHIFDIGVVDQHYKAYREATYLVGIECLVPCNVR